MLTHAPEPSAVPPTRERPPRRCLSLQLACAAVLAAALPAAAQLTPMRACVTRDKPIPAQLNVPAAASASPAPAPADAPSQAPRLLLLDPANTVTPLDSSPVPASGGRIDLAEAFPVLWSEPATGVRAIQLESGGKRVGPALWLVPMVPPPYAARADRTGVPLFVPPQQPLSAFSGYWLLVDKLAVFSTDAGPMTFRLRTDLAPRSVMAVRSLIEHGFYDDTPVFRVASLRARPEPDIVQFGDPTATGLGGPGFFFDLEPSTLKHDYGALSLARAADPNSAGSQLIIALSRDGAAQLDGKYSAIGQMVGAKATAALSKLAKTPVDAEGRPRQTVIIDRVELVDAPPLGEGDEPAKDPASAPPGGR